MNELGDRQRRLLFYLAAAIVALSLALVSLLNAGSSQERRAAAPAPTAPPIDQPEDEPSAPALPPEGTEPPNPAGSERALERAEPAARRFLAAYLRYQTGKADRRVRRRLRAAADAGLARFLLAQPPRPPTDARAARGRLERLDLYGPFSGRVKATALVEYAAGDAGLIEFALTEHDGRWRVVELAP